MASLNCKLFPELHVMRPSQKLPQQIYFRILCTNRLKSVPLDGDAGSIGSPECCLFQKYLKVGSSYETQFGILTMGGGHVTMLNTNTPGEPRVAVESGSKSFIIRRRETCHKSGKEYRRGMANTWYSPIARKGRPDLERGRQMGQIVPRRAASHTEWK